MFSLWSNFALDSSAGTAVNSADASEASTELTDLNIASWKEIFGDGHAGHPLSSHQEPVEASDGGISRGTTPTGQGDVAWPYKGAASAREEAVEGRQGGVHSGGVPSLPLPPTAHAMHDGGNAVDIDWQRLLFPSYQLGQAPDNSMMSALAAMQQGAELEQHSNLYVSNIPETWNDRALRTHFSQVGPVLQCRVLPSKAVAPGLSGLVMMADVPTAMLAIERLNGQVPVGGVLPLMVRLAACRVPLRKRRRRVPHGGPMAGEPAGPFGMDVAARAAQLQMPLGLGGPMGGPKPFPLSAAAPAAAFPHGAAGRGLTQDPTLPMRSLLLSELSPVVTEAEIAQLFWAFQPIQSVVLFPEMAGTKGALVTLSTPHAAQQALLNMVATYQQNVKIQLAGASQPPVPGFSAPLASGALPFAAAGHASPAGQSFPLSPSPMPRGPAALPAGLTAPTWAMAPGSAAAAGLAVRAPGLAVVPGQ